MTSLPHVSMTYRRNLSIYLVLSLLVAFPASAFAAKNDEKRELYNKGMQAVNNGDAINARDAFCQLAHRDNNFYDVQQQCLIYDMAAQRLLMRYKINYAEGLTLLAEARYDEAAIKLRNVKSGDYAVAAQQKLAEIPKIKAAQENSPQAEFDRLLHLGDSGANFQQMCDGNERFEDTARAEQHSTRSLFCGGWVRGTSQALRLQMVSASSHDVCLPQAITVGKQTTLLLRYIQKHPSEKDAPATDLLNRALRDAYPCRLKNDPDAGMYESE